VTAKLISVIGPPAVGKTTLAEQLAEELPAQLIREDYAGNPFLAESYNGSAEARLPGQLYFLMSRVKQLSVNNWPEAGLMVSDYGFCQDRIFAEVRLRVEELRLYDRVASRLDPLVHAPDMLVHLDACEERLLERIARRGRSFERVMTEEFLSAMRNGYDQVTFAAKCPVIHVDCDVVKLEDDSERAPIVAQIREKL
jgi:deoxyguanosine kinase